MVSSCNTCSVEVLGLLQCSYVGKNNVSDLKVLWFGTELLDLLCGFAVMIWSLLWRVQYLCDRLVCERIVFLFVWRLQ